MKPCLFILVFLLSTLVRLSAQQLIEPEGVVDPETLEEDVLDFELHAGWDSLYVSEGRDNLDGDSLFTLEANGSYGLDFATVTAGAWYAEGSGGDYSELNVYAAAAREIAGWEFSLAYTRLDFLKDDEFDNELSIGVAGEIVSLETGVDFVYSTEAEGFFVEAYVTKPIELSDQFSLAPGLLVGLNSGYVVDESDGFNHIQPSVELAYTFSPDVSLTAYLAHTFALQNAEEDTSEDLFVGGVGLHWGF